MSTITHMVSAPRHPHRRRGRAQPTRAPVRNRGVSAAVWPSGDRDQTRGPSPTGRCTRGGCGPSRRRACGRQRILTRCAVILPSWSKVILSTSTAHLYSARTRHTHVVRTHQILSGRLSAGPPQAWWHPAQTPNRSAHHRRSRSPRCIVWIH
jgi:hypothetical protein